ncbi:MAG: histidine phosphatase family protein [Gemmobacter sp.]
MIRLALLRHGATAWNRAGRIQGRSDIPLDPEARTALAALRLPEGWAAADLVASPLARAAETARLVAGRPPRIDPALTEMHWGAWEGAQGAVLRADRASGYRDIEYWGWDFRPPGGESPADLRARLVPFLAGLSRDTVAVTHIGVMRVILALAHAWDFDGPAPFRIKRGRLFAVTFPAGDPAAILPLPGPERLVPVP